MPQRPDDLDPYYDVYEWQPATALEGAMAGASPAGRFIQVW
jgi:hypothetical protein